MDIGNTQHLERKAEFARRMGWNRSTVTRFGRNGRLVIIDGMVDVEASMRLLAETSSNEPHHRAHVEQLKRWRDQKLFTSVGEKMARWKAAEEKAVEVKVVKKRRKLESQKAWREANPEKVSFYASLSVIRYRSDPAYREKVLAYHREKKAAVVDWYARQLLRMGTNPPEELVQVKRLHLLIKKALRRIEDEKH